MSSAAAICAEPDRATTDVLALVAHELRGPLNAVIGWAQLLRDGMLSEAERSRAIETILRNAVAQERLIADLFDCARIAAGRMSLEVEPLDAVELAAAAIAALEPVAAVRDIRLTLSHDGPLPMVGDSGRLAQVLRNLLINAVKFSPDGGTVALAVERLQDEVVLHVRDAGAGIAREVLPLLFERQRPRVRSKQSGLGLGLTIARHIVELHGGTIAAHSAGEGHGATFTVRLPQS
jgi:signal transduction histidine kinase